MNDEIYIVAAYTPDDKRENLLRNLVNKLHNAGKEILLITHSLTPNDIVKKCKYYIYDEENKILFDDRYKYMAWNTILPGATIWSKDKNRTYSTILPVYRLLFNSLGISKLLGYKYAHYIEYDCDVENFDFFKNNLQQLKTHGCVAYTNEHGHPIGFYMAYNLSHYTYEELKYDENKFLTKFTEYYPTLYLVEQLTRYYLMETKNPCFKNPNLIRSEGLIGALYCSYNSETDLQSWVIPIVENSGLWMFISELDNKQMIVEYVVNTTYKKINISPREYTYFWIGDWDKVTFLKIMVNKKSHLEYDLSQIEVRNKLIQNNTIERTQ